jgi:uncharacterized protein YlxW (UPF0749 family)
MAGSRVDVREDCARAEETIIRRRSRRRPTGVRTALGTPPLKPHGQGTAPTQGRSQEPLIFVAVFVVVNLFIVIVINNLESVKHEQRVDADRASTHHELLAMIETVRERLAELEDRLRATPPRL